METLHNARKYAAIASTRKTCAEAKREKICNQCREQARENMRSVPSAGKHVAGYQALENKTGAKRGGNKRIRPVNLKFNQMLT